MGIVNWSQKVKSKKRKQSKQALGIPRDGPTNKRR
jgi:hypothetical protein